MILQKQIWFTVLSFTSLQKQQNKYKYNMKNIELCYIYQ